MGARSVGHAVVVDQPRDRMAAARAANAVKTESRNRLRCLKERYWAAFEDYLRLVENEAPQAEIKAARSRAWEAHHAYGAEQIRVDTQTRPRGRRR